MSFTAPTTPVSHYNSDERTPLLYSSSNSLKAPAEGTATPNHAYLSHRPSFRSFVLEAELEDADADTAAGRHRITLVLENRGSVARDHLASERTFLAYIRTSLAIAAAGVALIQLFLVSDAELGLFRAEAGRERLKSYGRPLAGTSIIIALYLLAVGVSRYFSVQTALVDGKFPVIRLRLGFLTLALAALIVCMFAVLLEHGRF
ncbi:hypothetical protein C8F01DRAFT_1157539 [Mycena amicta]|nr:hypothetical protein C8F01DRAFT_1157539 [Mycena amicta]